MKYPVLPVIMPADLKGQANGKLDVSLMRPLKGTKGALHHAAATAFNCLQMEAYFAGVDLQSTSSADTYRSYERQERTFLTRYSKTPTGRVPIVTRKWEGRRWYLRRGSAPSASPGTSNHGWGLAIDIAGASGARLAWMMGPHPFLSPVLKYGFSWEVESGRNAESWHIRYVCGDKPPAAVELAVQVFPDLKA
jgi:LAS superfamily LD-carboxypeptidase LdcB